ncbi:hypothetical protein O181_038218 [Austropuccinia psidii MF-1]|uniref:Protein regulator of cytokinesis 1-like n=1 Tax=Austropuccinia psidii MF-1 TaxID=1389203 RepID=A0A9Q3HAU1_9BASI|nr:hypothetical protein [Austropuccinia psidii MF-1]
MKGFATTWLKDQSCSPRTLTHPTSSSIGSIHIAFLGARRRHFSLYFIFRHLQKSISWRVFSATCQAQTSDPLVHLSRTLAQHQNHLVNLYTSLGHADPKTYAANKISELHIGILDTIENQAREAEKEVAQLTKVANEITEQIKNLRIRLGHLDLEADLSIPNEVLVPKLERLKKLEQGLSEMKCEREIQVERVTKKLESYAPVLGQKYIENLLTRSSQSLRIGQMFGANLSLEFISRLEKECESCQEESDRRRKILSEHLNEIFTLWGHLGISPSTPSSDPSIDHSDIDPIVLTHLGFKDIAVTVNGDIKPIGRCESVPMLPTLENIEKTESRRAWLDTERVKREEQIQNCYDQLCILWTRLGVPEEEQEQFVESWRGLSEECVAGYQAELARMIEAKKEHMVIFIQKERDAIKELWDQMFVSEQDRASVQIMNSEDYSEELLAAHEQTKLQLIEDLEDQKPLLIILNKYFTLLQDAHELALAEKDPNRFAKGKRGDPGRLLREEKIRKRVAKEKPKLENDLKTLIPKWENERGRPFMVNGSRFLEDLVIRLEQEAATKGQAASRSKSVYSSTQTIKRQQTGTPSRTASPVKRTRMTDSSKSRPPVSGLRGSAKPFGAATPRAISKASSSISATRQKIAPQVAVNTHTTRALRSINNAAPPVSLQYQRTGSSMSYYNPITPTPLSRAPPSVASTADLTRMDSQAESVQSYNTRITEPSTRSVSVQSSCPGIPPGWPTCQRNESVEIPQPNFTSSKYTTFVASKALGKGMPAPPLKKAMELRKEPFLPAPLIHAFSIILANCRLIYQVALLKV